MIEQILSEQARLMDEALARACKLGRPFEEQEVFKFIWEQGYCLHPDLDNRFELYREAHWQGKGEKKKLTPRLWIVKTDETAAIEESLNRGDFTISELEESIVGRRLSVRVTAQVDYENGELEVCDREGVRIYDWREALELRELLNGAYKMLYALANQEH